MKIFTIAPLLGTCAIAAFLNRSSNKSSENAAEIYDFSGLASFIDIRKEAAGLIEAFKPTMAEAPEKRYQKAASAKSQLDIVLMMADDALKFLPSESEARPKMEKIRKSYIEFIGNENSKEDNGKIARQKKSRKPGDEKKKHCQNCFLSHPGLQGNHYGHRIHQSREVRFRRPLYAVKLPH